MRNIFLIIICILICKSILSREIGQTEITTEEGIEVFQNEKYYLLKKNVVIESDNFILFGDLIKISFEKDLYDIKIIDALGNVKLDSEIYKIKASGPSLLFTVDDEKIYIKGNNSKLITEDTIMLSDGEIEVINTTGEFLITGPNSKMEADNIFIEGRYIDGIFNTIDDVKEIDILNVKDDKIAYVKNKETDMYANIVKYSKQNDLIELENNVKIIRDGETVTGDYGTLDTNDNSYKVKSKQSNKVKVIIIEKDE